MILIDLKQWFKSFDFNKIHPDINKELRADELFVVCYTGSWWKLISISSCETKRKQYLLVLYSYFH